MDNLSSRVGPSGGGYRLPSIQNLVNPSSDHPPSNQRLQPSRPAPAYSIDNDLHLPRDQVVPGRTLNLNLNPPPSNHRPRSHISQNPYPNDFANRQAHATYDQQRYDDQPIRSTLSASHGTAAYTGISQHLGGNSYASESRNQRSGSEVMRSNHPTDQQDVGYSHGSRMYPSTVSPSTERSLSHSGTDLPSSRSTELYVSLNGQPPPPPPPQPRQTPTYRSTHAYLNNNNNNSNNDSHSLPSLRHVIDELDNPDRRVSVPTYSSIVHPSPHQSRSGHSPEYHPHHPPSSTRITRIQDWPDGDRHKVLVSPHSQSTISSHKWDLAHVPAYPHAHIQAQDSRGLSDIHSSSRAPMANYAQPSTIPPEQRPLPSHVFRPPSHASTGLSNNRGLPSQFTFSAPSSVGQSAPQASLVQSTSTRPAHSASGGGRHITLDSPTESMTARSAKRQKTVHHQPINLNPQPMPPLPSPSASHHEELRSAASQSIPTSSNHNPIIIPPRPEHLILQIGPNDLLRVKTLLDQETRNAAEAGKHMKKIRQHLRVLVEFCAYYEKYTPVGLRDPPQSEIDELVHRCFLVAYLAKELYRLKTSSKEKDKAKAANDILEVLPSIRAGLPEGTSPPTQSLEDTAALKRTHSQMEGQLPEQQQQQRPLTQTEEQVEEIRQKRNNPKTGPKGKYQKRSKGPPPPKCTSCGTKETPEWRRGPDGKRSLCNACGLHYAKLIKNQKGIWIGEGQPPPIDVVTLRQVTKIGIQPSFNDKGELEIPGLYRIPLPRPGPNPQENAIANPPTQSLPPHDASEVATSNISVNSTGPSANPTATIPTSITPVTVDVSINDDEDLSMPPGKRRRWKAPPSTNPSTSNESDSSNSSQSLTASTTVQLVPPGQV